MGSAALPEEYPMAARLPWQKPKRGEIVTFIAGMRDKKFDAAR
jgi:hypothetical protein